MTIRLALLVGVLLLQTPPDPDYVGPEDPAHQGQPLTCSNSEHIKAVKHDCPCKKTKPEQCDPKSPMAEQANCLVYCRKPACHCSHPACQTE